MIALYEEEQSGWENETVSSSLSKIEDKGKDEQLAGRTIFAGNRLQVNLVKSVFLPVLSRGCDFVGECFRKIRAWFFLDRVLSKRALPVEEFERKFPY